MFSLSLSPNSIFSKKFLLLFSLFLVLGIFLVGEKSWGAGEKCGEGNKGTCKEAIDNLAQKCSFGWSPYNYDSATQCKNIGSTIYRCCIADSVCAGKSNGAACEINGKSGTCSSEVCYENNTKKKIGESCGANSLGTCQVDCSTVNSGLTYYGDSSDCASTFVCCINECSNKTEGEACKADNDNGNCLGGKCITSAAKPGEPCGVGGKCIQVGAPEYQGCVGAYIWGTGGRGCEGSDYVCCRTGTATSTFSTTPTTSCGTKGGTCITGSNCPTNYTEDSESASVCASDKKCCYKPPANPGTKNKAFSYPNPLYAESFTAWAEKVLNSIQSIVGWLAVIMIMIGGIVYLTSAGTKSATWGREIITAALIGFAAVVAGPSLLKEIKDLITGTGTTSSGAIDSAKDIKAIITSVLNFLLIAMGSLSLIGFVIGGFFYLTAFGDKGRAESGRKIATNSLYAIALAGGGLILVKQILSLLGS